MPDPPPGLAGQDLPALVAALRAANARLREVIEAKDAQLAAAGAALEAAEARFAELSERVTELERRPGRDSPTSPRPPSSDSPYKKKPRDRSLRERSGRGRVSSRARNPRRCARWPALMTPRARRHPAGGAAPAWPALR